ncbi:Fe-S cluster assembly protein SufD [Ahrensia kielensis]|uniref:Fe-S cluster assembly protein SufD n=1 Tax=Ahrensia kielensis TaxID=76980 RepID=UPI000376E426|nr:Fe-S cluster assembly protein SufD [Ahrensia kielensis]
MNIQAPIKHTAAEEVLFQSCEAANAAVACSEESQKLREAAVAQLRDNGFPTRRVESWHYTDLRAAVKQLSTPTGSRVSTPLLAGSKVLSADTHIAGVKIEPWSADKAQFAPLESDDAVGQINTALATCGSIATIEAGQTIDTPLSIENRGAHARNVVSIGAGASATIIESVSGDDGFSSDVTLISLAEGAKATYVATCEKGADAIQLGQLRVALGKDANLDIVIFNAGGRLIRREIIVLVEGEGSNLDIKGVNLIGGNSHIDVTTVLQHTVPNTVSEQLFRNISTGKGQGVFQGQIKVHQIAQKTDAQMACNTLLLSNDASFSAKPELEIFADDVICAHGATVAELDEDHLFYLCARGITERTARALLVEAFVDEAVEQIENEALVEALETRIGAWLEANG